MALRSNNHRKVLFLFDVDYTLVDGADGHKYAFGVALEKVFGFKFDINSFDYLGKTDKQIIKEVLKIKGFDDRLIESKLQEVVDNIVDTFKRVVDVFPVKVLPGVRELLDELKKRGVLLALVTGNVEPIARGKLSKVELNDYFQFGGFGSDGIRRADLIRTAINRAEKYHGFLFDNNAYIFGDTPRDVEAGKEVRVKTVGVATGSYSTEALKKAGADFVFPNLENTQEVIKTLLGN